MHSVGFEPTTPRLRVECSPSWATNAYCGGDAQIRTGGNSFADCCLTTWRHRHMVERDGVEPTTRGFSVHCSTCWATFPYLVHLMGLEPMTPRLKVECSSNWATGAYMAGVEGFEPSECRSQSPVPYRLAIPQCKKENGSASHGYRTATCLLKIFNRNLPVLYCRQNVTFNSGRIHGMTNGHV